MSKQQEALRLALEALEELWGLGFRTIASKQQKAITAIREALAEQPAQQQEPSEYVQKVIDALYENSDPVSVEAAELLEQMTQQQEPVAYAVYHRMGGSKSLHWPEQHSEDGDHNEYQLLPLYTSPPASKPLSGYINAAGINANDSPHIVVEKLERAIEAKLKEKNHG